jgi:hypothetical protein
MAKSTLELYSAIILPKLQDRAKTCDEMDVPRYAAQHLKAHKLIACRMRKLYGAGGHQLGAVEEYMLPEHVPPKLMDCAHHGLRCDGYRLTHKVRQFPFVVEPPVADPPVGRPLGAGD